MNRPNLKWTLLFVSLLVAAFAMIIAFKNDLPFFDIAYYAIVVLLAMSLVVFFIKIIKGTKAETDLKLDNVSIKASGSVAVFIIALMAGYYFKPIPVSANQNFDLIINVLSREKIIDVGVLYLTNGDNPSRSSAIHAGQAVFHKLPLSVKGTMLMIRAEVPGFENSTDSVIAPEQENFFNYLLKPKIFETEIHGTVTDKNDRIVRNALLDFESGLAKVYTDSFGNYRLKIPVEEGSQVLLKVFVNGINRYDHPVTISSETSRNIEIE